MLSHQTMFEPFSPENTELMLAMRESAHGQALASQIRYDRYCYLVGDKAHRDLELTKRVEMHNTWAGQLLDADVSNLHHHAFTALLGQAACRIDELSVEDTDRVVRALLVHDVKEAVFSDKDEGDLTYDEDHAGGEERFVKEHRELGAILHGKEFPLTKEQVAEVVADMNDNKKDEPETVTGMHVNIAERLGYLHSGINAARAAHRMLDSSHEYASLEQHYRLIWMAENTFANSLERMLSQMETWPSIRKFFTTRSEQVRATLEMVIINKDDVYSLYEREGKDSAHVEGRKEMFFDGVSAWYAKGGYPPRIDPKHVKRVFS